MVPGSLVLAKSPTVVATSSDSMRSQAIMADDRSIPWTRDAELLGRHRDALCADPSSGVGPRPPRSARTSTAGSSTAGSNSSGYGRFVLLGNPVVDGWSRVCQVCPARSGVDVAQVAPGGLRPQHLELLEECRGFVDAF